MPLRKFLIWTCILALPGTLWQSWELFGLTMGGQQMLFFSIAHTNIFLVALVFLTYPLLFVLAFLLIFAVSSEPVRSKLRVPRPYLAVLLGYIATHLLLLEFYGAWSAIPELRVLICLAGIAFLVTTIFSTFVGLCIKEVEAESTWADQ